MDRKERSLKNTLLSLGLIAVLSGALIGAISLTPSTSSRIPAQSVRPSVPPDSPRQTVTSPVPTVHSPSPSPKPRETKIYVVAKNVPSYWGISRVITGWNMDRFADFVPLADCPKAMPCVTIKMDAKLSGTTTAAQTTFGYRMGDIVIDLNPDVKMPWEAQSTACHEMGHVLGAGHINGTNKTCMTPKDAFYRVLPSSLDLQIVNGYGTWELEKMYRLSGKDVDVRTYPK